MWDTHINNRININVLRYLCDIKKGCRSNAQSSGKGLDILAVSLRRVKSFQIWADRESCCGVWHRVTRVVTCHVAVTISACDSWRVTMGAGGSKERLSKADMEFLLLHTHYDEKTIQGGLESFNFIMASYRVFRVVPRLHVWLSRGQAQHPELHEDLLQVLPHGQRCRILWSCVQVTHKHSALPPHVWDDVSERSIRTRMVR